MLTSQYEQNMKQKNFFLLPNAIFELQLNKYEFHIYAYLIRTEDRRTYQCIVSYPTIAGALGISVNTVAKYVRTLEERGLIRTERTEIVTRDGRKRNGCLRYHILPMQNALDRHHERRLAELELVTAQQKANAKAEKLGVEFLPACDGQSSA
ncbi:helix-turn-helix domain-containing protein [Oscillibacter hominis]|uniref:Helix-turn-helix domain-containing protein n=2 Tax=Oscillibacter hominis TaxID=2763056 RepID=A0A7G9B8C4_9FIRM|nr:helix-turn-helix domain-containing protein [Oscillibacter hominis]